MEKLQLGRKRKTDAEKPRMDPLMRALKALHSAGAPDAMDHEELERRNHAANLRHPKRSHRRPKKTQAVKKPMWRAQNFRSRQLWRGVTRRSDSSDEGRVRAAAEGESHQHQQQRTRRATD